MVLGLHQSNEQTSAGGCWTSVEPLFSSLFSSILRKIFQVHTFDRIRNIFLSCKDIVLHQTGQSNTLFWNVTYTNCGSFDVPNRI
jgi:hypothetical protein